MAKLWDADGKELRAFEVFQDLALRTTKQVEQFTEQLAVAENTAAEAKSQLVGFQQQLEQVQLLAEKTTQESEQLFRRSSRPVIVSGWLKAWKKLTLQSKPTPRQLKRLTILTGKTVLRSIRLAPRHLLLDG